MENSASNRVEVVFLGTGTSQGVPVIGCSCAVCRSLDYRDKRLRTSVCIQKDGFTVLVDPGPDLRQQCLRAAIKRIDAIIITHEHKDHISGLDDIRPYNFLQGGEMPVYAWPRVLDHIRNEFAYIFSPTRYPGIPRLELIPILGDGFTVGPFDFQAITVMHAKLPVMGLRHRNFAYITDAKTIDEANTARLLGLDHLVINALQHDDHISHFTLAEAIDFITQVKAKKAYLTHMSHTLGHHLKVERQLPAHVNLAYDGLKLAFSSPLEVSRS